MIFYFVLAALLGSTFTGVYDAMRYKMRRAQEESDRLKGELAEKGAEADVYRHTLEKYKTKAKERADDDMYMRGLMDGKTADGLYRKMEKAIRDGKSVRLIINGEGGESDER